MQKTPLVRMAAEVRYLECNHSTIHLPVADISGALLHHKFAGDLKHRLDEAIARKEHFAGAISYRRLQGPSARRGSASRYCRFTAADITAPTVSFTTA